MVRARLCVRPLFLAAEIILGQRYKLNPCFLALRRNIMFRSFKKKYHILYWIAEITDINYMFTPPPLSNYLLSVIVHISHFSP